MEVKVKVDNFRSGDHRVETDGDLAQLGSRFPRGQQCATCKSTCMRTKEEEEEAEKKC